MFTGLRLPIIQTSVHDPQTAPLPSLVGVVGPQVSDSVGLQKMIAPHIQLVRFERWFLSDGHVVIVERSTVYPPTVIGIH